jgi:hypothetical protein
MGFADGIWRAVAYFLAALWIWAMYRLGLSLHKEHRSKLKILAIILGITGVLTYMSWSSLGTHVEGNDEPLFGGGGDVVRDYKPTTAQRNRASTTIFLLSFLPLAAGGLQKDDPTTKAESRNT